MAQVYGYKEQDNDFRFFPSEADFVVVFSAEQLHLDLVKALDIYASDFNGPQQAQLVDAFKCGHLSLATIETVSGLERISKSVRKRLTDSLKTL